MCGYWPAPNPLSERACDHMYCVSQHPSTGERTFQGYLKRVEVAVAVVRFDLRQRLYTLRALAAGLPEGDLGSGSALGNLPARQPLPKNGNLCNNNRNLCNTVALVLRR